MASNAAVQYKERASKAYAAMEHIGVHRDTVTPYLRRLLELYDNAWEFIEAENYRALKDVYFEESDPPENSRGGRATRAKPSQAEGFSGEELPSPDSELVELHEINPELPSSIPAVRDARVRSGSIAATTQVRGSSSGTHCGVDPQRFTQASECHRSEGACRGQTASQDCVPRQSSTSQASERADDRTSSAAAAAAAAAHELEKGKSPLVEENISGDIAVRRRLLSRIPSQDCGTPDTNLVPVKLEVPTYLPLQDEQGSGGVKEDIDLRQESAGRAFGASGSDTLIPRRSSGDIILSPIPLRAHDPHWPLSTHVKIEADTGLATSTVSHNPNEGWIVESGAQHEPSSDASARIDSVQVLSSDENIVAANQVCVGHSEPAANPRVTPLDGSQQGVLSERSDHTYFQTGEKGWVLITPGTSQRRSVRKSRDLELPADEGPSDSPEMNGDAIRPNFLVSGSIKREAGRTQDFATVPKRQKVNAVNRDAHAPREGVTQPEGRAPASVAAGKRKAHASDSRGCEGGPSSVARSNGNNTSGTRPALRSSHSLEPVVGSSSRRQRMQDADLTKVKIELDDLEALHERKPKHDPADISRGTEKLPIPFVNEFTSETVSDKFNYIPSNVVYQMAYINISLARIGDEDCCLDCTGNCLDAPHSCPCSRETGGEYAYTPDGLLKPSYIAHELSKQDLAEKRKYITFCSVDCPIERAKNDTSPEKCKGHQLRKFVKECWHKCGCSIMCGNRVVQRGISRRLQVFFTNSGKGWGIRAAEFLPAGAFVCEYVGEILTNMELDQRNQEMRGHGHGRADHKDTYPVLLDGDWCSEQGLKDEEALCLDATKYGNVARFINHRCWDANLIDIPVSIEGQDRHYYHVAFFTCRDVDSGEELTWDYSIDFDDKDHPIEAFRCLCNSKYCRGSNAGVRNKKHRR